jgi:serine protease Do
MVRLFVAALLCIIADTSFAASLVETIAKLRPSIVGISSLQPTRLTVATVIGSGFVVGDGKHVITSYHVIKQQDPNAGQVFYVMSLNGSQVDRRSAKVVATDPATDLAILIMDGPSLPPVKLRDDPLMAPEGTEIATTGFPIGVVLGFQPTTTRGIVSALPSNRTPEFSAGGLSAEIIRAPRYSIYQLDIIAYPGNSGGPVYDTATGEVLGVVAAGFIKSQKEKVLSDPSAITYAMPSGFVRNLMLKAGLKN